MKNAIRILFLLTFAGLLVAKGVGWTDSSWFETVGVITGAACLLMVVERRIWNFPIGIISCSAYLIFFAEGGLYAVAGLQIVSIILSIVGWISWAKGNVEEKPVSRIGLNELAIISIGFPVVWLGLKYLLEAVNGPSPVVVFDAFITSLSLVAQWMINRRQVESWLAWIVVDQVSIVLYWSQGMHLTAGLYTVYLIICVVGFIEWRQALDKGQVSR